MTPNDPRPDSAPADVASEAPSKGHGTARERLLEAAGRLFAERGSDNVSIREIAAEAGVRHGGVNYHFKSKRELYLEVLARNAPPGVDVADLRDADARLAALKSGGAPPLADPVVRAALAATTPDEARRELENLVRALVRRMTAPPSSVALGLMHQEMRRTDGPDDAIFFGVIEPQNRALAHVLGILAPSITDERELALRALQVKSQCLILRVARPVVQRLLDAEDFDEEWVERITRSVVTLTLRGFDETAEASE